jgi:DNA polymerase-3 subunit beta
MRVRIDKSALHKPLYRAQGVIDRKATHGVLGCVHLVASDQKLVFTATDYDVTLSAEAEAIVDEPGSALINGRAFFNVVRSLPDGVEVTLASDGENRVRIEAGRSRYHLNTLNAAEFPDVGDEGGDGGFVIDKSHVDAMFKRTQFSVSLDESRPALNGVLLEVEPVDGGLRLRAVSTDGHRLSRVERRVEAAGYDGASWRAIVHRRGVAELARILDGDDPRLQIEMVGRSIAFSSDHARLLVRQIDEAFPEYQRVIPDRGDVRVVLSRPSLMAAIRRVSALGGSGGKHELVKVELGPGSLALEMTHADYGDAHEELEVPDYDGEPVKVGFNQRYLLEVLGVLESEQVSLDISDQFSPCLLQSDEEPGAVFVVMPMRL